MASVFKTKKEDSARYELAGIGLLGEHGKGGVPVERAADVMPELQQKNDDGSLKLDDDGNPIPLTGKALADAAKKFADDRGFTVENVSEEKIETLAQELGIPPDRPPAAEISRQELEAAGGAVPGPEPEPEVVEAAPPKAEGKER